MKYSTFKHSLWLIKSAGVAVGNFIIPKKRQFLLHAFPDLEDQTISIIRSLILNKTESVPVVLLISGSVGQTREKLTRLVGIESSRVALYHKEDWRGIWAYWRSSTVIFTHGLYGMWPIPDWQTVVNAWHGMPVKKIWHGVKDSPVPPCTWLLSTSLKYSKVLAEASGFPEAKIPVLGLPRNDLLFSRTAATKRFAQQIKQGVERVVLFLPTYRKTRGEWLYQGQDGVETDSPLGMSASETEALRVMLKETKTRLLVKPHPVSVHYGRNEIMDENLWLISDSWLHEQGVTLYEALGQTDALFTDISSVYVDYLSLRRPVFFYFPDLIEYRKTRTFQIEPVEDWLAGPLCATAAQLFAEWKECCRGNDTYAASRVLLAEKLNPQNKPDAAAQMMEFLGAFPGPSAEATASKFAPIIPKEWFSPIATMAVRVLGLAVNFTALALIGHWSGSIALGLVVALNGASYLGGIICSLGIPTLLLKSMTGHLMSGDAPLASAHYVRGLRLSLLTALFALVPLSIVIYGQQQGFLPATIGSFGPKELLAMGICSVAMSLQFVGLSAVRSIKMPVLSGFFQFCLQPLILLICLVVARALGCELTLHVTLLAFGAAVIVSTAALLLFVHNNMEQPGKTLKLEPLPMKELASLWMLSVLGAASANVPLLLAALLLDQSKLALLGVPYRICYLPMTVVAALGAYYAPRIREANLQNNYRKQRKELVESQYIGVLLVMPVLFAAIFLPDYTLSLFGIADPTAHQMLLLFAFAQLFIAGCGVSEQYLAMLSKSEIAMRYTLYSLLGLIAASLGLEVVFGVLGLGIAWTIFAVWRQVALRIACSKTG